MFFEVRSAVRLFLAFACMAFGQTAPQSYRAAIVRRAPEPGIRFSSGLTVCDEALRDGRWVGRYWLSTGMIKPEWHLERERHLFAGMPIDAFELGLEGQDLAGSWRWVNATQTEVHGPDGLLITLELESTVRPISVKVNTLLHGGPILIRWLEIRNRGNKPTAITKISPWSGMLWNTPDFVERLAPGQEPFEVGYTQYQEWGHEGAWKFDPVVNTTRTISGVRGKSGWGHPTFFAKNNATGEWFVGSLGWSGNWTIRVTGQQDRAKNHAHLFFSMGPSAADPALRVLESGETVKSPEVHLFCMQADLDHVIQALHDHVRRFVLPPAPPGREYQVESNHRGYIVDHEDEPGLLREVDLAKEVGAELFMIDAGWYGPEPNRWAQNVGDWYAGEWLPHDITPVREYARKKGLLFGLWVEIESVGSAATLRKKHPDWVLTRNGQPVANGRQLDVANPEVAAWMESEIARIIQRYDLDMFRIDYNTTVEEGGNRVKDGFVENTLWRHVDNLYAMFDRLRKRFPNVIFQNCAGGGGRLDLGILRRFHNTELSDWMRGPRSLKILNGMTWILPPEILLRTFGTEVGDHATDGNLDMQLRTVMMCRPIFRGISPSVGELNPLTAGKIRDAMEQFKHVVRPIMAGSRVYHHTALLPLLEASPWVVLEYATTDSQRAVAALFRTSQQGEPVFRFHPRGLDLSRTYQVSFGNSGQTIEIPGSRLLQDGIPVRLEANLGSEMLIFRSEGAAGAARASIGSHGSGRR